MSPNNKMSNAFKFRNKEVIQYIEAKSGDEVTGWPPKLVNSLQ